MPRRARPQERKTPPDPKYGSVQIQEFNNKLMQRGKLSTAQRILYGALTLAETTTRKPGNEVFDQALKNASPLIEVKPRRVGGATYQVPVEIRADRLAGELVDAMNNAGGAVRRKEETHKMAEANKAFSHYKW